MRKATISFAISVRLYARIEQLGFHWTGIYKLWFDYFLDNPSIKFNFNWHMARITDTLHEELCKFMAICRWIIFKMRNVSDEHYKKIHIFYTQGILSENLPVHAMVWNNTAQPERPQIIKQYVAERCTITDKLIMFNTYCFFKAKLLGEIPSILDYTYISCLVLYHIRKTKSMVTYT